MKPYTPTDAEADLRAAIDAGDQALIERLGATLDAMEATPAASILGAALWYAEQGLHIFPLQPRSKIPHPRTRGCKDATTDPDTIRAWWTKWPESNLGLATGHLVDVVDIDGAIGQLSRVQNWPIFDRLDVIARVTTPRAGGMHLYVPAAGVGNKAGLLDGVDYRGVGGYVVAPPSVTDDGAYRFLAALNPADLAKAAA